MKSRNFISILIPVYKEPELLDDIIDKLLNNEYKEKEILVGIDGEITAEVQKIIDKYSGKIFVYSDGIRRGKPKLLNYLSNFAKGDIFLFLDNDVELPKDKNFLEKLNEALNNYDIVELPKEAIVKNFFSKLISYDFLASAVLCYIVSKFFKTNLFLSGAAFGIKRDVFEEVGKFSEVINEDWDLMLKLFKLRKKYFFAVNLKVKTIVPSDLKEWIRQRVRWSIGIKSWWKQVVKDIKQFIRGLPIIFNIILFCSAPLIFGLIIKEFNFFSKFIPTFIILTHHLSANLGLTSFVYLLSVFVLLLQGILPFLFSLLISSLTFFVFSKILRFRFDFKEYLIYSLFYFPILVPFYLACFVFEKTLLKPVVLAIDWKS